MDVIHQFQADPIDWWSFSAGGSFRNEVTDSARYPNSCLKLIVSAKNLVTDEELKLTKSSMTGAFARSLGKTRNSCSVLH
jgi:putative lipase involved disintegration of autophagic bodies